MFIKVTRDIRLPDPVKIERYRHRPELGPGILFFSGGSALRDTCAELIQYTHNSIHVITPFDSGGSSAKLREAFQMPAIGDVRNRLLALADRSLHGYPEIFRLFACRFPPDGDQEGLRAEMEEMIGGRHPLVAGIPDPMRKIIRHYLQLFKEFMPPDFDLRKASIGNLILTAGYLDSRRNFDTIIFIFSKLVQVRGVVRPVVNKYLHLAAAMEDGRRIVGQHLMTGKEASPIASRITDLWLASDRKKPEPVDVPIRRKMASLIEGADLICYPMGSFYSSLIANLLPRGVGRAVSRNTGPKVFIPSTGGGDPETFGMGITDQVRCLTSFLRRDDPDADSCRNVLDFVLVDLARGNYRGEIDRKTLTRMGIEVIDTPLVSDRSHPLIDERLLVPVLLSLA
ncbi:GAK system CofD-like protein [Desulfococcus sp.]|uniref:GAK system CofD-like protein n=1 Tax=Desulfococcus sp. TaxID=2025834 RepID=UPI0035945215